MSDEKIDVLAVMDTEIVRAGGFGYESGRRLIEARTYTEELIEAARRVVDDHTDYSARVRLRAALACVRSS